MQRGWNADRGAFVQHYDDKVLGFSPLRMARVGFIARKTFSGGDYSIVAHAASSSCRNLYG